MSTFMLILVNDKQLNLTAKIVQGKSNVKSLISVTQ
jgi:hypothetical protein